MSKRQHPTPWKCDPTYFEIRDAEGRMLESGHDRNPDIQVRIVRAVNSFESPTARAERAVLRVVMAPILDMDRLNKACRRLLAAKAKDRHVLFPAAVRFPGSVLATSTKARAKARKP